VDATHFKVDQHGSTPQLMDSLHDVTVVANKAYDCDGFADQVARRNSRAAFPQIQSLPPFAFSAATTANAIGSRTSSSVSKPCAAWPLAMTKQLPAFSPLLFSLPSSIGSDHFDDTP
jgi:hypothetical protein